MKRSRPSQHTFWICSTIAWGPCCHICRPSICVQWWTRVNDSKRLPRTTSWSAIVTNQSFSRPNSAICTIDPISRMPWRCCITLGHSYAHWASTTSPKRKIRITGKMWCSIARRCLNWRCRDVTWDICASINRSQTPSRVSFWTSASAMIMTSAIPSTPCRIWNDWRSSMATMECRRVFCDGRFPPWRKSPFAAFDQSLMNWTWCCHSSWRQMRNWNESISISITWNAISWIPSRCIRAIWRVCRCSCTRAITPHFPRTLPNCVDCII